MDGIRHALFGVSEPDVRRALVLACLALFDAPLIQLHGLNSSSLFSTGDFKRDHVLPWDAELMAAVDLGAAIGLPTCPAAGNEALGMPQTNLHLPNEAGTGASQCFCFQDQTQSILDALIL